MTREVAPAIINRNLFTQVDQDSGSLTSATTVVHRFAERGDYRGVLIDGRGVAAGEFSISVGGDEERRERREAAPKAPLPMSVHVDLSSLHASSLSAGGQASSAPEDECEGCGGAEQSGTMRVASEGYAVFKVPAGAAGGYAVELYESRESGRGEKVFDSRVLGRRDMLVVVLLRPGTYSVTNARNRTRAELKVAYPEKASGLLEAVKVVCAADGIHPDVIRVRPTQGLVFNFETPSRVKIDLVSPEDRATPSAPVAQRRTATRAKAKREPRRLYLYPRRGVRR